MEGGTVFHFVTEGAEEALRLARKAAGDRDIRIGGGAATIREYLTPGRDRRGAYRHLAGRAGQGRGRCSPASTCRRSVIRWAQQVLGENATHIVLTRQ